MPDLNNLHPSVTDALEALDFRHINHPMQQDFARKFAQLAFDVLDTIEGPALTRAIHLIRQARDEALDSLTRAQNAESNIVGKMALALGLPS